MTVNLTEQLAALLGAEDPNLLPLLDELQPFDLAELLTNLETPLQLRLLSLLPAVDAANTMEHLDHDRQYHLLDHLPDDVARAILSHMSSDDVVDLIGAIHPRQAQEILGRVPPAALASIQQLMTYPENSAGGIMTVSYLVVRRDWTVQQVLDHFRKVGRNVEVTSYIYATDMVGRLAGVTSLRDILLSAPQTRVSDIMFTKAITIEAHADQEEAAKLLGQYDFFALPVVDGSGRMVGVITADDIMDVVEEEATEDIQRLGGSVPLDEPYLRVGFLKMFRSRIGWLLILFVAESFTGTILRHHEELLTQIVALAFFVPLLINTGGNSGSQASTLVIRAMAVGEVTVRDFFRVVWREASLGLVLGLTMAAAAFLRAMMLGGPVSLGLTVAITISLIVIVGSTVGAALPIIGRRFGVDPAIVSAPLITTLADGAGLLIYFAIAKWIMGLGGPLILGR